MNCFQKQTFQFHRFNELFNWKGLIYPFFGSRTNEVSEGTWPGQGSIISQAAVYVYLWVFCSTLEFFCFLGGVLGISHLVQGLCQALKCHAALSYHSLPTSLQLCEGVGDRCSCPQKPKPQPTYISPWGKGLPLCSHYSASHINTRLPPRFLYSPPYTEVPETNANKHIVIMQLLLLALQLKLWRKEIRYTN